ncbi:MAG: SiaB family protein kinase [Halothiobacillaceae bacterium]|nr:SiaB family protein kinase [Halothiobacillaceae bacterium]
MDIFQIFNEDTLRDNLLFYYSGYMSHNVIGAMGDTLRYRLETQGTKGATIRKVFSTFIEMAQNILNYGGDDECNEDNRQYSRGAVAIGQQGEHFYIICGNHIDRAHLARVREKLEAIRAMSPAEIKQAYKQQLRTESSADEASKGAGLGFLTVARDASEPIEFCFIEYELPAENVGFYLKAVI